MRSLLAFVVVGWVAAACGGSSVDTRPTSCASDADCASGQRCTAGSERPAIGLSPCALVVACETGAECRPDEVCAPSWQRQITYVETCAPRLCATNCDTYRCPADAECGDDGVCSLGGSACATAWSCEPDRTDNPSGCVPANCKKTKHCSDGHPKPTSTAVSSCPARSTPTAATRITSAIPRRSSATCAIAGSEAARRASRAASASCALPRRTSTARTTARFHRAGSASSVRPASPRAHELWAPPRWVVGASHFRFRATLVGLGGAQTSFRRPTPARFARRPCSRSRGARVLGAFGRYARDDLHEGCRLRERSALRPARRSAGEGVGPLCTFHPLRQRGRVRGG